MKTSVELENVEDALTKIFNRTAEERREIAQVPNLDPKVKVREARDSASGDLQKWSPPLDVRPN